MLTVLLIESEPANLIALALILRSFGYSVLEAESILGRFMSS
jgi:CheY-like chemotaxis protein